MKKITAFIATIGLVALLSTPLVAQPMAAPAPAMAPATMTAPAAMRPVAKAPVVRAAPRPRPRPRPVTMAPVMRAPARPVAMAPINLLAKPGVTVSVRTVDSMGVVKDTPLVPAMAPVADAMAPAKAAPAEAKKDSKGSVIGGGLLEILLKLIGILLGALIPVLIAWVYKKLKLTDLQSKDMVDGMVLKAAMFGIGKAEEAAHKMRDNPMSGAEKLDLAISTANKYLTDSGLPQKGADYLKDVVESSLGLSRDEGNGKSKLEAKPEDKAEDKPEEKKDEPKEDKKDEDKDDK